MQPASPGILVKSLWIDYPFIPWNSVTWKALVTICVEIDKMSYLLLLLGYLRTSDGQTAGIGGVGGQNTFLDLAINIVILKF